VKEGYEGRRFRIERDYHSTGVFGRVLLDLHRRVGVL
jgi:hypothetical protein